MADELQVGDFVTWNPDMIPGEDELNIRPSIMKVVDTGLWVVKVSDLDGNKVMFDMPEIEKRTFGGEILDLFDQSRFIKQDAFIAAMMQVAGDE